MSFVPANIGGGGGGMTRTTLWTNTASTSAFSSQTVTLSDSISNYDYIGVEYRATTASSTRSTEVLFVSNALRYASTSYTNTVFPCFCAYSSSAHYARYITFSTNTKLSISSAGKIGAAASDTTKAIPLHIYGYKL